MQFSDRSLAIRKHNASRTCVAAIRSAGSVWFSGITRAVVRACSFPFTAALRRLPPATRFSTLLRLRSLFALYHLCRRAGFSLQIAHSAKLTRKIGLQRLRKLHECLYPFEALLYFRSVGGLPLDQ